MGFPQAFLEEKASKNRVSIRADRNVLYCFFSPGHRCAQGQHHEAGRRPLLEILQRDSRDVPQHRVRVHDRGQHHDATGDKVRIFFLKKSVGNCMLCLFQAAAV